jgi:superfamily II DNA/RNA helicase
MPKNKKPAGGRPAKNFDPSYARKSAAKSGSRSPGHRGYRAEDTAAPKKERWNAEERAARGRDGDRRSSGPGERPAYGRDSRDGGAARDRRDSGYAPRPRYGSDERAPRRYDRDATRNESASSSGRGSYGSHHNGYDQDRAPRRSYGTDDRPARRDDVAPRRYGRDDRSTGRDSGDRGQRRDSNDRPSRSFDSSAPRRYGSDRDERNTRDGNGRDSNRRDGNGRDSNRRESSDRPARREYGNDRPRREYNGERPARREYSDERPAKREYSSERPARREHSRDNDGRPARREYGNDRDSRSAAPYARRQDQSDSKFYPSRNDKPQHFAPEDDVVLERLEAEAIQAQDVEGVTFGDLGLGNNIVAELATLGAAAPFPIQAATIPDVIAGKDVLGRGRTGSGKTIAFGAPLVEKLMENGGGKKRQLGRAPRALILAPTRELALQIDRTVQPIARSVGLFTTQIYGGVPQHRQVGALQRGVDIVIGTPGRIEDLIEQGRLDLSQVTVTVLDEADHMCDLGFLEPVQRILRHTAEGGQKLLFSATLDKGVAKLVDEFLVNPAVHEVAGEDQASSTIDHRVFVIEHRDKGAIIEQLADRDGKTLVFARTRAFAEMLADQLDDAGIPAVSLHGDLNQSRRTRNLAQLTSGRVSVLVATDVAARGIHVDDIDLVIQADAPDEYKTYLHRSGRTGRAGKQGTVVTLIPKQRVRRMDELLERAEIEASFDSVIPGDQLVADLALSASEASAS